MEHLLIVCIVVAALFAIFSTFVPIDARVQRIVWIVLAALLCIWAVKLLLPMV